MEHVPVRACRLGVEVLPAGRKSHERLALMAVATSRRPRKAMPAVSMPYPPVPDLASELERRTGLIAVPEMASILGLARSSLYDYVAAGRIPHVRIGSAIRFDPRVMAHWLREHSVLAA